MGYRIDYGQPSDKRYPAFRRPNHLASMICGALVLFLLLTNAFWPSGRELLRDLFIPGDPEVTSEAFSALIEDVRAGEDVSEAVTAFCREILSDDQMPD